jgi:hypothetical protein
MDQLIYHVVVIRWKPDLPVGQVEKIVQRLNALPASVPSLRKMRCSPDLGWAAGNFDFGLVAEFEDRQGWQVYMEAREHRVMVSEFMAPWIETRTAVQFEIPS